MPMPWVEMSRERVEAWLDEQLRLYEEAISQANHEPEKEKFIRKVSRAKKKLASKNLAGLQKLVDDIEVEVMQLRSLNARSRSRRKYREGGGHD